MGNVAHPSVVGVAAVVRATLTLDLFGLELPEETLEEAAMALLIAQDIDNHILRDPVDAIAGFDDLVVVGNRAALCVDHALDNVDDE